MRPFIEIPPDRWPEGHDTVTSIRVRVLKNDAFLVQVFAEPNGYYRLSVNAVKQRFGVWKDGITWDQLQEIKRLTGYGDLCAVEIYPPDEHLVNVANLRHLWIVPEPPFMWKKDSPI